MYVRAISNISGMIFSSMVYSTVDLGWYTKYIVYNKSIDSFELIDYIDKTSSDGRTLIQIIQPQTEGFDEYGHVKLLKLKKYCEENNLEMPDVKRLFGYPDVCENYAFICDIIANKVVQADHYPIQLRDLPDVNEWQYIQSQEDAQNFMNIFAGFHDSYLVKLTYEEVNGSGIKANVIFDNSCWFGVVELCFEGVQYLRIVPPKENYSSEILSATLHIDEEGVFWADCDMEKPDMSYDGSIIRSLSLKWKKLEKDEVNGKFVVPYTNK